MKRPTHWLPRFTSSTRLPAAAVAGTVFVCGLLWQNAALLGGGAALLCLVLRRVTADVDPDADRPSRPRTRTSPRGAEGAGDHGSDPQRSFQPSAHGELPQSTDALVDELLASGRYALLLRPTTKQHLAQSHTMRAVRQLDEAMALVPGGHVLLGQLAEQSNSACGPVDADAKLTKRNLVSVDPVYIDRFCVTNEEYQQFIDSGGYEQLEFWHEEALPALLDFVDHSGAPGPRFWSGGQYPNGEHRLPVTGVSWYEAAAYARWVGKRLPTDSEWTKAGAWPVESAPGRIAQRRYPWGESFDVRRAHLYGSGFFGPVAVEEFPGGVSVGGIHQLIGNVWEWTSTPLIDLGDPTLHVSESVMSVRGGAFDTYFENQATCHYQSGEHPLSRRRNIGFRLALPMADLETPADNATPTESFKPVEQVPVAEEDAVPCATS